MSLAKIRTAYLCVLGIQGLRSKAVGHPIGIIAQRLLRGRSVGMQDGSKVRGGLPTHGDGIAVDLEGFCMCASGVCTAENTHLKPKAK